LTLPEWVVGYDAVRFRSTCEKAKAYGFKTFTWKIRTFRESFCFECTRFILYI